MNKIEHIDIVYRLPDMMSMDMISYLENKPKNDIFGWLDQPNIQLTTWATISEIWSPNKYYVMSISLATRASKGHEWLDWHRVRSKIPLSCLYVTLELTIDLFLIFLISFQLKKWKK